MSTKKSGMTKVVPQRPKYLILKVTDKMSVNSTLLRDNVGNNNNNIERVGIVMPTLYIISTRIFKQFH